MRPLVTAKELTDLRSTDPANVPVAAVTGPGRVVRVVDGVTSVEIPTDVFPIYVNVVGGLVDDVDTAS